MSIIALNYTIPVILVKILQCVPRFDKQFFQMNRFTKLLALAGLTLITMVSCNNISESQKADIVLENIFTRKSVRKFTSEPVSDKQVETLLKAAMAAPSAMNKQPWRF